MYIVVLPSSKVVHTESYIVIKPMSIYSSSVYKLERRLSIMVIIFNQTLPCSFAVSVLPFQIMCRLYSSSLFLYALYINMIDTSFGQFAHTKLTRSIQQLDNESKLSMSEQLPRGTRISLAGFAFGYFKPQGNVLRNTLRSLELQVYNW